MSRGGSDANKIDSEHYRLRSIAVFRGEGHGKQGRGVPASDALGPESEAHSRGGEHLVTVEGKGYP